MNWFGTNDTRVAACAVLIVLSTCSTTLPAQDDFQVDAGGAFLRGSIHGRLQTPVGGNPGTTSPDRPSLKEIGIDDVSAGDFWANLSRGHHGLYFGGRLTHLSGDRTLESTLVSQGITFPAGSPVESDVRFDWYRLGYRYLFRHDFGGRTVEFYPSIGGTLLDFHYTLSSPGIENVDRSYAKVGGQVGAGMTWPFMDQFSLTAQVLAPIPVPHWPQILSAQAAVKYRFLQRNDLAISGLVGIDYDWIAYKDSQRVPNDIKANIGPMGMVGLEIHF